MAWEYEYSMRLKRHQLPNFHQLGMQFDVAKLRQALAESPQKFDDLLTGYREISMEYPKDEESFGLVFADRL
jgi:hypothetical protein